MDEEEVDIEIAKLGLTSHFQQETENFDGPQENLRKE